MKHMFKIYTYNSPIQIDIILNHLNQFKNDFINEVKYIDLSIQMIPINPKNNPLTKLEVFLCRNTKVNLKSQMIEFIRLINKNCKILTNHFNNEKFTEIHFIYKEISYSEYIAPSRILKKRVYLKTLVKKVKKNQTIFILKTPTHVT